ncbi:MAG TPA: hypothetical protein EYP56_17755, partial [Planctomycetaceae bacterium]|nr:hypothetical protein [Planctomycetaceae bacterium]
MRHGLSGTAAHAGAYGCELHTGERTGGAGRCACGWLFAVLLVVQSPLALADAFRYTEGFESADPVQFWTANGKYKVNFKGVTEEQARSGKRSLKLDVTLEGCTYLYWHVPVRVPAEGGLRFEGWIKVEHISRGAAVGLGANYSYPPTRHSGCGTFGTFREPTDGWVHVSGDLGAEAARKADPLMQRYVFGATGRNVTWWVDRWGIFIYGRRGQRVVLYVDDVTIEGDVPEPRRYASLSRERFEPVRKATRRQLSRWRRSIAQAAATLGQFRGKESLPEQARRLARHAAKTVDAARKAIERVERVGYGSPAELHAIGQQVELLSYAGANLQQLAAGKPGAMLAVFLFPPITNQRVLPNSFPIPGRIGDRIEIAACPGEYEPATFAVLAMEQLEALTLSISPLRGERAELPADVVDPYVVKCWFQGKGNVGRSKERVLKPELLLKDDSLIRVDLEKKRNYMRTTDASGRTIYVDISRDLDEGAKAADLKDLQPRDADQLLPVNVPEGTAKQFWLTVHVPADAEPGMYRGSIELSAGGRPVHSIELAVRVLPFRLEPSPLLYSIYYRARLAPDGRPRIGSEAKSEQQMLAELLNMKAHGVLYPTCYQSYDERLLRRTLQLRAQAGLPTGPFFSLGISTGNATGPDQLAAKKAEVRKWLKLIRQYGYTDLYVYGLDEARGERLRSQRAAWQAVQEAGGKTFVAGYLGTFEAMGRLLNCLVFAGPPRADEAAKWHSVGSRIFSYANPQVGVEEPETYRRNFGLLLWKAGFDGAMDYAYQHAFSHIWNDFDNPRYRDHVFAYPT